MPTFRVKAVDFFSEDVFELVLDRGGVEFQPGDCFTIYNPDGVSRPFSASSGHRDPDLRFVIRCMPGGAVSAWLATRRVGEEIELSPPFGWFRPGCGEEPGEPTVLIATGTGIAPFLSALRSYPDLEPAICLYGVRSLADAVAVDYLRRRCSLRLCISREEVPPHGANPRIGDAAVDDLPTICQRFAIHPPPIWTCSDRRFFVGGPRAPAPAPPGR